MPVLADSVPYCLTAV